jgi:hypothetical protein
MKRTAEKMKRGNRAFAEQRDGGNGGAGDTRLWEGAAFAMALLIAGRATYVLTANQLDAVLLGAGAATILLLLREVRRRPKFTQEQLLGMQELIRENLAGIETRRQAIIDEGDRRGDTIFVDKILTHLEREKENYEGPNREAHERELDRIAHHLRSTFGERIPVGEAYRLMKELDPDS